MDTMENTTFGGYGLIIFLVLLFWCFGGNGLFGGCGNNRWSNCQGASPCEIEKQEIIDSARTQYLIEQKSAESTAALTAGQNVLASKIDFYAYQDLRDRLAEAQRQNMMLENKLYSDAQFNALSGKLDTISCQQLKAPTFIPYGGYVAATCGNNGTCSGCGF